MTSLTPENWNVLFLSTPSARRATRVITGRMPGREISIHALREEGDPPRSCISPPSR